MPSVNEIHGISSTNEQRRVGRKSRRKHITYQSDAKKLRIQKVVADDPELVNLGLMYASGVA